MWEGGEPKLVEGPCESSGVAIRHKCAAKPSSSLWGGGGGGSGDRGRGKREGGGRGQNQTDDVTCRFGKLAPLWRRKAGKEK